MKKLLILFAFGLFGCFSNSNNQTNQSSAVPIELNDSIFYFNKEYKMGIYFHNKKIEKYKLWNTKYNFELSGNSELITIDGEIPEGTNRIDYNNPNDIKGFECDSTYQFISDKISIAFAIEKTTKIRLDLSIYNSTNEYFKDGNYTLLKEN